MPDGAVPMIGGRYTVRAIAALLVLLLAISAAAATAEAPGQRADRVVVEKARRQLHLVAQGRIFRTYQIALGANPIGPKTQEGDGKTPEGLYFIDGRKKDSGYHRALHISYPSSADIDRARRAGVRPGGDIMIHGIRNGLGWLGALHRMMDWTQGCVAVTNREIEEIWSAVPDGTPIELRP